MKTGWKPRGIRAKSRCVWAELLPLLEDKPRRPIHQECFLPRRAVSAGWGYRLGNKGPGREHMCFTGRRKGKEITRSKSIVFPRLAVQAVPSHPPNEGAERTFTFIKNLSFQEKEAVFFSFSKKTWKEDARSRHEKLGLPSLRGKRVWWKFSCVWVSVDLDGAGLSLSFLTFGKDLHYVNNRYCEAAGPVDINCENSSRTKQSVSLWSTHCKSKKIWEQVQLGMTNPYSWRWTGAIISSFSHSLCQPFSPGSGPLAQLKLAVAHPPTDKVTGPPWALSLLLFGQKPKAHHAPSAKISSSYNKGVHREPLPFPSDPTCRNSCYWLLIRKDQLHSCPPLVMATTIQKLHSS